MLKILLLLLPAVIFSQNVTIDFIESKYIDALDLKVSKKGQITFDNNTIKIYYFAPHEKMLFLDNDQITIKTKKETKVTTTHEEPNIGMMFTFFKALFNEDFLIIEQFFKVIKKSDDEVILQSISSSSAILKITYILENKKIKKFEIVGQDETKVTIEMVSKK